MKKPARISAAWTGLLLALAAGLTATPGISAQTATTPAAEARFEVASVKPNKSGDGRVMLSLPPTGRLTATNVPLRLLLQTAFDVQGFQMVGGPSWIASDRFDIIAKAPDGSSTPEQIRPMLRALPGRSVQARSSTAKPARCRSTPSSWRGPMANSGRT